MDKLARYRQIIQDALQWYIQGKPLVSTIDRFLILDKEQDHYQLMRTGWRGSERIYGPTIHVDIINDKIWIQYDGTDRPIADALLEAGVPKEDIVLAFHPENLRQYTGFAIS
ncbi:hypothetical protein GGR92_003221 [Spirosoma lacussanchae]|uniref:XisI protein n=1 Tax=Spirosoma lacussanchae TaxID=1884249 RepID=UPI00110996D3|nr:XisI protein [Spirosoma lacussanchae]